MNENDAAKLAVANQSVALAATAVDPVEQAISLWAEATTRAETRERAERVRDKQQIIRAFFACVQQHPGEAGPEDVQVWRVTLERAGKSANTVYSYLSRLSSFYAWLSAHPQLRAQINANPVTLVRPAAPRPYQTEKTKAWTDAEMNALLDVLESVARTGAPHALRDYAVTLFYLYSGLRRNEVFGLRGCDVELEKDGLVMRYQRKGGKVQRREVRHPDVRAALLAYLRATGRLSVLQTPAPLWTRHDRAGPAGAPLSSRSFANNLKQYAAQAGMPRVNIHQTRHTYARIIFEDTGDLLETQAALDHENLATTRVYVATVAVKRDKHSDRIAQRRRLAKKQVEEATAQLS
jgi:integrase